ncbi:hypothetical protein B0H67DRAFT_135687 [Lasiosphaeris hirsuta]|uniref:Secreted protein n=1 Tax=Lasiosphaeris hirsuta TaxID=260670 RepID=A0AA40B135_9PEZI|nr:hypothetical protein B0H67DRAFT_135687 [Lasiosphaeris hirsuta]
MRPVFLFRLRPFLLFFVSFFPENSRLAILDSSNLWGGRESARDVGGDSRSVAVRFAISKCPRFSFCTLRYPEQVPRAQSSQARVCGLILPSHGELATDWSVWPREGYLWYLIHKTFGNSMECLAPVCPNPDHLKPTCISAVFWFRAGRPMDKIVESDVGLGLTSPSLVSID